MIALLVLGCAVPHQTCAVALKGPDGLPLSGDALHLTLGLFAGWIGRPSLLGQNYY